MATKKKSAKKKAPAKRTSAATSAALVAAVNKSAPKALAASFKRLAPASAKWTRLGPVRVTAPVWRPPQSFVWIEGDLHVDGNVVVGTGKDDFGVLVVVGNVTCRNLVTAAGWSFVCTGSLACEEAVVATLADSVTYVGKNVSASFVDSGSGAWLTLFGGKNALQAPVSGYVMSEGDKPVYEESPVELESLVVKEAIESEEWDAMSADERRGEKRSDYLRVDAQAALQRIAKGTSILREASRGRAG